MNALSKVQLPPGTVQIAHSILAYSRSTDELELELPIPLFLDTLALKIARVPPNDEYGASAYPLEPRAIDTFRFLLGLNASLINCEYFLEATLDQVTRFGPAKLEAVEVLTQVTPRPRYSRSEETRVSERELVLPTLRLLELSDEGWLPTSGLIDRLTNVFGPIGKDAAILKGRNDTYFSQKVRNMISHRSQPLSFIHRGLANYVEDGLEISSLGRTTVAALVS